MINPIPFELLALTVFASLVSLVGGIAFLYTKKLSILLDKYGVPFAAGTMIVAALVGLLPEAIHSIGGLASLIVFTCSFLLFYVLEKLLIQFHHHVHSDHFESKKTIRSSVPFIMIGDTIHNFIDGVAIAISYAVNPGLAVITTISTFLHEVPHEVGDFSILLKAGYSKLKVLVLNVLSALASLLGVVLVSYIVPSEAVIGYLLALTAGIFFYLGIVDFLPHAFDSEHNSDRSAKVAVVASVLVGAVVMAFSLLLVPHSHEHMHSDEELHVHDQTDTEHSEHEAVDHQHEDDKHNDVDHQHEHEADEN